MTMSHLVLMLTSVAFLLLIVTACSKTGQPAPASASASAKTDHGAKRGVVAGSILFAPAKGVPIAVRDFEVELRVGGTAVAKARSSINGVFRFINVPAATYRLCWNAQGGWAGGCAPHEASFTARGMAFGPVEILPDLARGGAVWGHIVLSDGTSAVEIDPLFGVESYPHVSVSGGPSVLANFDGDYVLTGIPASTSELTVEYEKSSIRTPIDARLIAAGSNVTVTIPNDAPRAVPESINAQAGRMVTLRAHTTDADRDPLSYRWSIEGGTVPEAKGAATEWKAPQRPGHYQAYVLAGDDKGGYVRKAITINVATGPSCVNPVTFFTCPPPGRSVPSVPCDQGRFLRLHGNTVATADAYYRTIDKNNKRLTLQDWWNTAGFKADGTGDPVTDAYAHASYTNANDLGFGRDMHMIKTNFGVFAYVTNYLNSCRLQDPFNARLASQHKPQDIVATVCMEFSSATYDGKASPGGTDRIVKFLVFDANNQRKTEAALDPSGAAPLPNLCVNCHGGLDYASGGSIDLQARFLPFDLATFQYEPPTAPDYKAFHDLNNLVAATFPVAGSPIVELINGWYKGGGDKPNLDFAPGDWNDTPGRKRLYDLVVARSCRTCHAAFDTSFIATWSSYKEFRGSRSPITSRTSSGNMPHALITFMNLWSANFWKDGVNAAALKCFTSNSDDAVMDRCLTDIK